MSCMLVEMGSQGCAGDLLESCSHSAPGGGRRRGEAMKTCRLSLGCCPGVEPPELGNQETELIARAIKADDERITTENVEYLMQTDPNIPQEWCYAQILRRLALE